MKNILLLKKLENRLSKSRVLSPRVEAERLLTHFGKINRLEFYTDEKVVSPRARDRAWRAFDSRKRGVPLAYLLKTTEFFERKFFVSKDVLIPRPETEILVEEALGLLKCQGVKAPSVLDLGTGSGCIAVSLTIERPDCRMTALDVSKKALAVARKNLRLHELEEKVRLVQSNLFNFFQGKNKTAWDFIVSNPPYIPEEDLQTLPREVQKEPRLSLDGGKSGLQVIYQILDQAPAFLKKDGFILMEVGAGQAKILANKIDKMNGFKNLRFVKDLAGFDRVLVVQRA